jgi:pre-60S factor REI1
MDSFTCITCRLIFDNPENQRAHYRTAWHCFNLKRKVSGLAPVTQDVFDKKVEALKADRSHEEQKNTSHQKPNSKKMHKYNKGKNRTKGNNLTAIAMELEAEKQSPTPTEPEMPQSPPKTEEELIQERLQTATPIPINESLFDTNISKDLESNLEYMRRNFGFFIPEIESLEDLEGLITYLGEKVGIGYTCLYCQKSFNSLVATKSHMVDKSHCKIRFYENLEEFDEFYDFGEEPQREGEDSEEEAGVEGGSENQNQNKSLIVQKDDEETWMPGLPLSDSSDGAAELILPSGMAVGHRSLRRYYKQRARPQETRQSVLLNQLIRQYNELGVAGIRSNKDKDKYRSEIGTKEARIRQHQRTKMMIAANKLPKYMRHKECMT